MCSFGFLTLGTPSRAPTAHPRNRPISPPERRRLAGGVPLARHCERAPTEPLAGSTLRSYCTSLGLAQN